MKTVRRRAFGGIRSESGCPKGKAFVTAETKAAGVRLAPQIHGGVLSDTELVDSPGHWEINPEDPRTVRRRSREGRYEAVARVMERGEETVSNAALIAAAPKLLAAAERLLTDPKRSDALMRLAEAVAAAKQEKK
jgi:hypothetical protein